MHAHAVPGVNSQPSSLSALGLLTQYSKGLPLSPWAQEDYLCFFLGKP